MASSDNLMAMEQLQWGFRPTFSEASWMSDIFMSKENETLTKALHKSLSNNNINNTSNDDVFISQSYSNTTNNTFLKPQEMPARVQTPSVSGGSENDAVLAKPRSGRITKRKSRASKRATTTFITADPANFRQMVQQVTGVRFDGQVQMPIGSVMKPEPQRAAAAGYGRFYGGGGGGGFVDTSSYLMDTCLVPPPSTVVTGGGGEFEAGFCSFPTLESWKV